MKIQVFGACLEYNAALTLQVLEHLGQVPTVLTLILTESLNMKHHFEVKRVVLGLSSLLAFAALNYAFFAPYLPKMATALY